MTTDKLSSAKDFGEFLEILRIPKPIQNIDYDDFPLNDVAEMTKAQLMDSFAIDDLTALKIIDGFSKIKKKDSKKDSEKFRRFKLFKAGPSHSKKKVNFNEYFNDLKDAPYHHGDQWQMDACSAAMSAATEVFHEVLESLARKSDLKTVANQRNAKGWTPLMYAAAMGRVTVAVELLDAGANVKAVNNRGQTAFMLAASYGHREIIIALSMCDSQTLPEFVDEIGLHMQDSEKKYTALHYAAYYAQYDALKELVRLGANPNQPDAEGNTPTLLCCVDPAQERCLKYLCYHGGDLYNVNADGQNGFDLGGHRGAIHAIYESTQRDKMAYKKIANPRYGAF